MTVATTSPLLVLCVILLAGLAGGWLAKVVRLPQETGYTAAGLLLGPMAFDAFGLFDLTAAVQPISEMAIGLLTVAAGGQLALRRMRNALRRVGLVALCESLCSALLVTLASRLFGLDWAVSCALGAVAASTSPATTIMLVKELRARGPYVKTLLSVVALDLAVSLALFALARELMTHAGMGAWAALAGGAKQLVVSLLLGVFLGLMSRKMTAALEVPDFSAVFLALLLAVGLSHYFGVSFLLTCLFLGVYLANAPGDTMRQVGALEPLSPMLGVFFFVAAGASLHFDAVRDAGLLCLPYLLARIAGKYAGAFAGGWLAGLGARTSHNLGLGLAPQAGIAVGLVLLLEGDPLVPQHTAEVIGTLVLASVTLNEVIGPFFTWRALHNMDEINRDRRRLIDFLHEENITVDLRGGDKGEVLRQLVEFYAKTHHLKERQHAELMDAVARRENEFTTAIGHGAAIPHGRVNIGKKISGVLGICREGADFGAYDQIPVRILMLVVTPDGTEKEHLEVMGSLARMIHDETVRDRLAAAVNPYDAWEVIESHDARNYNYYLGEEQESSEV